MEEFGQLRVVVSIFLAISLPSIFLFLLSKRSKAAPRNTGGSTAQLPPGPRPLPLIGNLHCLVSRKPAHHVLRDLAGRYGPLVFLSLGEMQVVVVSSPEAAKEILKTHEENFLSRFVIPTAEILSMNGKDVVFAQYGDYWRELRKIIVLKLLSARNVRSFRQIREDEVGRLVLSLADGLTSSSSSTSPAPPPAVNLRTKLHELTTDIASRAIIGDRCKEREALMAEMDNMGNLAAGFNVADLYPSWKFLGTISSVQRKAKRCIDSIHGLLDSIISDRQEVRRRAAAESGKADEDRDVLDMLLRILGEDGHDETQFNMDSVKAIITDMFAAGVESSAATMEWVMVELTRNPRVMQLAQQEVRQLFDGQNRVTEEQLSHLKYLHLVIRETLRLHPPLPLLLPRRCGPSECEILGYRIPKDAMIMINAWAIGRHPASWSDNPEEFRPERFDNSEVDFKGANMELIPFGSGKRICPGLTFGIAIVELTIASLLFHFDWILPNGMQPSDIDILDEVFAITVHLKSELKLHPVVRVPPACYN